MSRQIRFSSEPDLNFADMPVPAFWIDGATMPWIVLAATTQQIQSAGIDAWQGLQQDIRIDADEASYASEPHEILERQTEFVMTEAARWVRMLEQCWAGAFDVQSQWVRQVEMELLMCCGPEDATRHATLANECVDEPG